MASAFDQFCEASREALSTHNGPEGRRLVQQHLETLLNDPDFVAAECGPDAEPGIRTIYRDKETGFNVLVHVYEGGKKGPPHDHGRSWAVYGQAAEWTDMTTWKRNDDGDDVSSRSSDCKDSSSSTRLRANWRSGNVSTNVPSRSKITACCDAVSLVSDIASVCP